MCQRTSVIVLLLLWGSFAQADDFPPANHVQEPELRLELLSRDKADQEVRTALVAWLSEHGKGGGINPTALRAEHVAEFEKLNASVKKADQENTDRLADIVQKHDWPTKALVGKDGSHAAFL